MSHTPAQPETYDKEGILKFIQNDPLVQEMINSVIAAHEGQAKDIEDSADKLVVVAEKVLVMVEKERSRATNVLTDFEKEWTEKLALLNASIDERTPFTCFDSFPL